MPASHSITNPSSYGLFDRFLLKDYTYQLCLGLGQAVPKERDHSVKAVSTPIKGHIPYPSVVILAIRTHGLQNGPPTMNKHGPS